MQALVVKAGGGVLLEEALALGALRASQQCERPPDHVRRHDLPDAAIIIGEVLLGDADVRPVHAIGMGEANVALI